MNLAEKTWPQIEEYLKTKNSILFPVGSTEQHGPNGLIGIDFQTAWAIAQEVGEKTKTLVAPPFPFGMALHHMAFPGTMTLTPTTYIQTLAELFQSLTKHGFKNITVVNGHGGNIAPITSAFSQTLQNNESTQFKLINWWHLPEVQAYEKEHFGEKNGFHATCGEVATTMHLYREVYKGIPAMKFEPTVREYPWPMSPGEFRKMFHDGRMGSDPSLATPEHGQKIFALAVDAICQKMLK